MNIENSDSPKEAEAKRQKFVELQKARIGFSNHITLLSAIVSSFLYYAVGNVLKEGIANSTHADVTLATATVPLSFTLILGVLAIIYRLKAWEEGLHDRVARRYESFMAGCFMLAVFIMLSHYDNVLAIVIMIMVGAGLLRRIKIKTNNATNQVTLLSLILVFVGVFVSLLYWISETDALSISEDFVSSKRSSIVYKSALSESALSEQESSSCVYSDWLVSAEYDEPHVDYNHYYHDCTGRND